MDLHERSLSVLGCRYVSEVIVGTRPCCKSAFSMNTPD